jgi:hypothetical protein
MEMDLGIELVAKTLQWVQSNEIEVVMHAN